MNLKLAFIFWFVMVVIAIANGFFGDLVVSRLIGGYRAHLYKTFFIITVIFVFSRVYLRMSWAGGLPVYLPALSAGLLWLSCSIIFEFIIGHYVFRFPWSKLFADYRIWQGRLWSLVLASEVALPLLNAYLLRGGG
ncbi:MAG: hypothetical protein ACE5GY_06145 [Thermodesulfobacteriota bacterium]